MMLEESLNEAVTDAAEDYSKTVLGASYDACREYIAYFLGEEPSAGIAQQLRLKPFSEGTMTSKKLSNVVHKVGEVTYIDVGLAVGAVVGAAINHKDENKFALAVLAGALFFFKRIRDLKTIDLGLADSRVVMALHSSGGNKVDASTDDVLSMLTEKMPREEVEARLEKLQRLGVVRWGDAGWKLVEQLKL